MVPVQKAPLGGPFSKFIPCRFYNQNSKLNDKGFDSKGGLPHFNNEEGVSPERYDEGPLADGPPLPPSAPPPPPEQPAVAAAQRTGAMVMTLNVNKLKEELRKRGRSRAAKKGDLQDCLKEAILNNVQVALGNKPRCLEAVDSGRGTHSTARQLRSGPLSLYQDG
jgi:hypothetical protein